MAKVSYLDLPPGYAELYFKALQPGDRFQFSRVRVKDIFLSRARVKGITFASQFKALAPDWAGFDSTTRTAWETTGELMLLTGWKCFVRDTTQRRKAGLSGFATPSPIYSGNVGRITVEFPASAARIVQAHPTSYYVLKKVTGTKAQYSPVPVYEPFSLPLELTISYRTELTAAGANPRARFYAVVLSSYQGRDIETEVSVEFGLSDDWTRASATLEGVIGAPRGYVAYVEILDATGTLYFDAPEMVHDSENWARDFRCDNISQTFTHAFYQVSKAWALDTPAEGVDFGSWYYGA